MRPFRRTRGRLTASFDSAEVALLADLIDQVRELLAGRRSEAPPDPLVAITGMTVGSATTPEDPALARLLPDFHREDPELSSALRMLREPDIIAAKDAAAVDMLDSLPRGGGTVHLPAEVAQSWIAALNDIRLALGVRLGVNEEDEEPEAVRRDPTGSAGHAFQVYRWLTMIQDSLVVHMLP